MCFSAGDISRLSAAEIPEASNSEQIPHHRQTGPVMERAVATASPAPSIIADDTASAVPPKKENTKDTAAIAVQRILRAKRNTSFHKNKYETQALGIHKETSANYGK